MFSRTLLLATYLATSCLAAQAQSISGQGTWESTLHGRDLDGNTANGFEAYYDSELNITWLSDANLPGTRGIKSPSMGGDFLSQGEALDFVGGLNLFGITDWRLPTMVDVGQDGCNQANAGSDCGWNVDVHTSELAHMYTVTLGNRNYFDASGNVQDGYGLTNAGPFQNLGAKFYWTDVSYAAEPNQGWFFGMNSGTQSYIPQSYGLLVWAVHAGDVSAVPELGTVTLMSAGLVVAMGISRRRARGR